MPTLIGVIEEIGRRGSEEVSVEWKIPNFPSLLDGWDISYLSPSFSIGDVSWYLSMCPNWRREAGNPASGWVKLDLWRWDAGPRATFRFSLGIRGSGAVEKSREGEKEFQGHDFYGLHDFCSRSYLLEHRARLMPEDTLNIRCVLKRPGAATAGALSHPQSSNQVAPPESQSSDKQEASTQTDEDCKEAEVPTEEKQEASTQTDEDCKEAEVHTERNQSSEKQAAIDDDTVEKNNNDEDHEESKNKKNVKQLSQVKSTKKISLPARHGGVIRSLKAILAGGRRADFTLKSGGGEWPVHRAILEGRSGRFEALFRGEWAERSEVRLDDVPEGALDGVLHFAYAGEVGDLSAESVCGTYAAAHRFLLRDLKSLCVEHMEERMGPEMVCGALAVAEGDLKERAKECFFRESDRIVATEGWKELKANHPAIIGELFQEFIKRERKNRRKEGE